MAPPVSGAHEQAVSGGVFLKELERWKNNLIPHLAIHRLFAMVKSEVGRLGDNFLNYSMNASFLELVSNVNASSIKLGMGRKA